MRLQSILASGLVLAAASALAAPPAAPPAPAASVAPEALAIDSAVFGPRMNALANRNLLIRAQVILDRAHFSPGVIDGADGTNFRRALGAFETADKIATPAAVGLPRLDATAWGALAAADGGAGVEEHVITPEDLKGPFVGRIPADLALQAKLPHLGYSTPLEALAEAFHMDPALLTALNPGADFGKAGTRLLVVRPATTPVAPVARVEVDKSNDQVRAFDAGGKLVASFPATVGSTERPAPSGAFAVRFVVTDPSYTHDPSRLTFGKASEGKMTIQPGPNNPVGSTWIDLTIETYGIHGTPDPRLVGKTASHGCVRLTNWDAAALGHAVKKGTAVDFVGAQRRKG